MIAHGLEPSGGFDVPMQEEQKSSEDCSPFATVGPQSKIKADCSWNRTGVRLVSVLDRVLRTLFVCLIVLFGCRGSKSPEEAELAKTVSEETVEATPLQNGYPRAPEAAMLEMIEGLRQNRPVAVWQAMPAPFQNEINGLVREFARKMDPALWQQSFATWEKLALLLAEKKPFILSHPELAALTPEQRQRLERHWDGLVELLAILVKSELSDLKQMESFEMGRFLEQTGGTWFKELADLSESLGQDSLSGMLSGLTPKTLAVKGDKATMAWMTPESPEPVSNFSMIQLEGRWVPAGWAMAFEQIRDWRGKLRQMPAEAFKQQSAEKIQTLLKAERTIDALRATQTAEEFHQNLSEALGESTVSEFAALIRTLSGATTSTDGPSRAVVESQEVPADGGFVTLFVNGATNAEDEDRIFADLEAALPGDVDVQFQRVRTTLKVTAGPVGDLDQFAKRLTFGTITKTDPGERTLHIDMKR
jgi:hypothetical protein